MRKWLVPVLIGVVVCSMCGATLAGRGGVSKEAAVEDLVEVLRAYSEDPLEGPVELELNVPAGTAEARLVYERLSFDEVHEIPAVLSDGMARAVIPTEHTTQPGLRYHWEVECGGRTLVGPESYVPFIAEGAGLLSVPGDYIIHDIEYNGGKVPDGTSVAGGQGVLPHKLTKSQAPITSKELEVRNVANSQVHKAVDYGIREQDVFAVQDGVVHKVGENTTIPSEGKYVYVRHQNGAYFSHYFHLGSISVIEGQAVTKGTTKIGTSGKTGTVDEWHLDAGYDAYDLGVLRALYPFKYFVSSGAFDGYSTTDFDFIQRPTNGYDTTLGSYTDAKIEPAAGSSGGAIQARVMYRQKGTSGWSEGTMSLYSGITYRYWWDPVWDGKTMEYYIKVWRQTLGQTHYATRPAKYHSKDPGLYYEITVKKGSAGRSPKGP